MAANSDKLTTSLSESLLTLLAVDTTFGTQVASIVSPELFEPPLDDIANRILKFREQFKQPPGIAHLDDLCADVLEKNERKATLYKHILSSIIYQYEQGINPEFIFSKIHTFVREQRLKSGIIRAIERFQQNDETKVEEAEQILHSILKDRVQDVDIGTFLNDPVKALRFLDKQVADNCPLGIEPLDKRNIGLTKKELLLMIGARKSGKSFFCVHCGKQGVKNRWNTVHITLENSEEITLKRYFQSFLGIGNRNTPFPSLDFKLEREKDKYKISNFQMLHPNYNFEEEDKARAAIKKFIANKIVTGSGRSINLGLRFHSLVVKYFPTSTLTMTMLENYLDTLIEVEKFIPDMLILDYPRLMKLENRTDYRLSLGQVGTGLRRIAGERNMAVVTVQQSNRAGERATVIRGDHVAEDISLVATADSVLTFTRSDLEKRLGLGRIYVSNLRNEEDGFQVCVTQSYATAQFAIRAIDMGALVDTHENDLQNMANRVVTEKKEDED
ncbi:MAG TPA: hypothetical protein VFV16_06630 [Candidatus Nitrosotalea sp.]|nr:hypothetical protein [Candidatus Nitrosotalea sp.]